MSPQCMSSGQARLMSCRLSCNTGRRRKEITRLGLPADFTLTEAEAVKLRDVMRSLADDLEGRVALGAIQTSARMIELHQAVEDREGAMEGGVFEEQFYQEWCENHSWAFGNAYTVRDE